ncbi:22559_t:CDS:2, partial [Gigaspora rosea]
GNLTDLETIMLKIKAAQSEKNRLLMLLAVYTDDVVANPKMHPLFKDIPELNEEGIANILSFYETASQTSQTLAIQQSTASQPQQEPLPIETDLPRRTRCTTTKLEKDIFDELFESEDLSEAKSHRNLMLSLLTGQPNE